MVVISLIAIGISVIADLIVSASARGIVDAMPEQGRMAVLVAVGGIVFLNVAAFFLTFITEPERLRTMATESAKDKIHALALQRISQKAERHAPAMAEDLSEQWVEEAYAQMGLHRRDAPVRIAPSPSASLPDVTGKETLHLPAIHVESEDRPGNGSKPFHQSKSISES